ncbi:MAG: PadR family transcriptional regulator [Nitrososphaeria archaeon]|nr:PadR family transcriptional regulator [Conexivisphaerales archaeon]
MKTAHLPKGLLEFYILSLLSTYPAKGIELIETIRKKTNGMWSPSPGSIYPLLRKLESEGLIYSVSSDNRYVVTEKGKQKLEELKAEMIKINEIINSILREFKI